MSETSAQHVLQGRTAGFITRLLAFVADLALMAGVLALGGWLAVLLDATIEQLGLSPRVEASTIYIFLTPFILGSYFVVMWSLTGRTVGKWFMGLKIVNADGQPLSIGRSVVRFLGYGLSAIVFWVGYGWVIIDDERQGWHDHMAKSWVVYDYERRKGGEVYADYVAKRDA